ncbi:MAG: RDD family protein [Proteobacteria bacterium]|uniref:RDD family protein n=1 Tax=Rudaea sp. TaxID=2136325 RepID=UPI0032207CEF|nr:RDD family protein [Pseudomonadota bacterium]
MNSAIQRKTASPAHLGWRLIAAVYDLFPLLALWFFATIAAIALTGGVLEVHRLGHKLLVQALLLAVSAAYFVVSWLRGGQTVGMKPWRLRVVGVDGAAIDVKRALLRFAVALVSLGALGLGFFWCLVDRERRAWHDIAAGTLLVRLEKNS